MVARQSNNLPVTLCASRLISSVRLFPTVQLVIVMRLRHIEVFHAIMKTGSLSNAAELLCVSQPAVSKVLAHAERSLGIRLFSRVHGRLAPTHEAELLFAETQKLEQTLEGIRALTRNLALHPQGQLRVGCLADLGLSLIPDVAQAFCSACPEVTLKIQTAHMDDLVNALLTRELDIAIAINPPARPGVTAIELGRIDVVCVGPGVDMGNPDPVSLQTFMQGNWIDIGAEDPLGEAVASLIWASCAEIGAPKMTVHALHIARALAARGLGQVLLDELTAQEPGAPVSIRPIEPALSVGVYAQWRDGGLNSHAAEMFVDTLRIQLARTVRWCHKTR